MNNEHRRDIEQAKEQLWEYLCQRHEPEDQYAMGRFVWLMERLDRLMGLLEDVKQMVISHACPDETNRYTHAFIPDVYPLLDLLESWKMITQVTPQTVQQGHTDAPLASVRAFSDDDKFASTTLEFLVGCEMCDVRRDGTQRVTVREAPERIVPELKALIFAHCTGCHAPLFHRTAEIDAYTTYFRSSLGGYHMARVAFNRGDPNKGGFGMVRPDGNVFGWYALGE